MASLKHRIEYLAALFGMAVANVLSARLADAFGAALGRVAHLLLTSRRRLAFDNMKQALGTELTDRQIRDLVRGVFTNLGRTAVGLARFRRMDSSDTKAIVDGSALGPVRRALEAGRGAVIVSAHYGNWELCGTGLAALGFPTHALALTQQNPLINGLVINLRERIGVKVWEVPANTRPVFRALQDNHLVLMIADQHASAGTLVMDFFGRPAAVARGPALFALRCDCPLVPVLLRRDNYDRHVYVVGDVILPPHSGDDEADIRAMTAAYLSFLEAQIRNRPELWMWTHDRWKIKVRVSNYAEESA
ncbi:MAG: lysophospholipid acyltransferase family protein [Candidatus Zixiibacteriota bacterium]